MSNLNVNLVLMMQYMLEITRNSLTIIVYHMLSILCFVNFAFHFAQIHINAYKVNRKSLRLKFSYLTNNNFNKTLKKRDMILIMKLIFNILSFCSDFIQKF